jgi:hypothetical protein
MRATMRRFTVGLVLCTSAAVATAAVDASETTPRRLKIHWSDPEGQFPFAPDGLIAEARSLFAPAGIDLEWAPAGTVVTRDHVQVILLALDRSGGRMGAQTMACVQRGPKSQPVAWILVPQVRAALGLPSKRLPGEEPLLSRALARVMAHEIIHLIAPNVPHVPGGLMNASMGRDTLLRPLAATLNGGLARAVQAAFESWPGLTGA